MLINTQLQIENIVKKWIDNVKHMYQNKEILLICCNDKKIELESIIRKEISNHLESFYINSMNKFNEEELRNNNNNNVILFTYTDINLIWFDAFKEKDITILFYEIKNEDELIKLLNSNPSTIMDPNPIAPHLFTIRKLDLSFILRNLNIIEDIIKLLMNDNKNTTCKFSKSSIKRYLFRGKDSIDLNRIYKDIDYFKATFHLTSRLAIFIYKICTFDLNANEKTIGLYFARQFGKSKILNCKRFNISNTKGYHTKINIYDYEFNIRMDIAIKLGSLNKLTNEDIFNTTGIRI